MSYESWASAFAGRHATTLIGGFQADLTCEEMNEWDDYVFSDDARTEKVKNSMAAAVRLRRYERGIEEFGSEGDAIDYWIAMSVPSFEMAREWYEGLKIRRSAREAEERRKMDEEYREKKAGKV